MKKQANGAFIVFALGVFMAALDNGIISSALTTLIYSFHVTPSWGAWVVTIYSLGLAITVPIIGKLSDKFNKKWLFLCEISLFGLGSFLVSVSSTFEMVLVSRFIQSLGGGGIFVLASSYIVNFFPENSRGRSLGILMAINGLSTALGPNIGSFILDLTDHWQWLFLINIPISIGILLIGYLLLPNTQSKMQDSLDWIGIFALSSAILCLMYGLTQLNGANATQQLDSPQFYAPTVIGLFLLVVLIFVEKHRVINNKDPLLPLQLLKKPSYRWTLVIGFLVGCILASFVFIPSYVEQVFGIPKEKAGYWFTPLVIAAVFGAIAGGISVDKKGSIFTLLTGSITCLFGFTLFAFWVTSPMEMVLASIFVGFAYGMMGNAPLNMLATEETTVDKGIALGTLSLITQLGLTIAPSIYSGFITRTLTHTRDQFQQILATSPEKLQADYSSLHNVINNSANPVMKKQLLQIIYNNMANGYNHVFFSLLIITGVIFLSVNILKPLKRKNKPFEKAIPKIH